MKTKNFVCITLLVLGLLFWVSASVFSVATSINYQICDRCVNMTTQEHYDCMCKEQFSYQQRYNYFAIGMVLWFLGIAGLMINGRDKK